MDITNYIYHPETLNKESLYELRKWVAKFPYYTAYRLLLLQNLYLLHDQTFGEELRKSALFLPSRTSLYTLIEEKVTEDAEDTLQAETPKSIPASTDNLIDAYLEKNKSDVAERNLKADSTTDYTGFLLNLDDAPSDEEDTSHQDDLVDDFIDKSQKIKLKEKPEYSPQFLDTENEDSNVIGEDYFTETLARIYIKQGRYEKAVEILNKLHLAYPQKNAYFADQIRFLEKLILNNKYKK